MAAVKLIQVTVAYATPQRQLELPVELPANCTAALAIRRSGILESFPELDLADIQIGIFAKKVLLDASLRQGDRIEIYRPLLIDPKQARLRRVSNKGN